MKYKKRLADTKLDQKLEAFGATLIQGPKGCGKTTTAKQKAKSIVEFQDEDNRENYLLTANTHPSDLLKGAKPRLFDEWQDAPKIWGAIRKDVDDSGELGQYILTGSTSNTVETPHTATLRISRMKMYPMSLYESEDSNGEVSLIELFESPNKFKGCHSDLSFDDIKHVVCRGGWPATLKVKSKSAQLEIARDLFEQTCNVDISNIDGTNRNSKLAKAILKSYSRNICTLAETKTILADIHSVAEVSKPTYYDYKSALEKLFIIEDIDAWAPAVRSKTSIRSSSKRNLIDPSIAAAALSINPGYLDSDYKTFGFLFESLCIRDLKIYASNYDGEISYYRDRSGLEADAILHLGDGRYGLIEIKLGQNEIDNAAYHLCKVESLIAGKKPSFKMILTGTEYGYKRDDGVLVVPIGCLKD